MRNLSFGESGDIKTQSASYRSQTNSPVSLHTFIQQVPLVNADLEYLKYLNYEELQERMTALDAEMEREIDELRQRYQIKRQPMLDAIDAKRRRQQHF